MRLEGLHHVTAITADAPRNLGFYAGLLGLRFVKKTVNFDRPQAYHLYYGDERGRPGSIMTFFEFPDARPGRPGAGMVHTVRWRVGSADALAFWERRLAAAGVAVERGEASLRFDDPEGLTNVFAVTGAPDAPLVAQAPDVPAEHALQGLDGVRAYAADEGVAATAPQLEALAMERDGEGRWVAAGGERRGWIAWDPAPAEPGVEGAGSVHHVAWNAADDGELAAWRERVARAGARPTPMRDRTYFHSVYFRTPAGVLFELATRDIGFHADEPVERLGEALKLPPQHEHLRERLEAQLTPLANPRAAA
ncbi:MAG TPA: VOC family protein [Solirubrobacteraceae bacterium]|jgi:glyoxalase family protein|nr:VOC family protein [Solirubrobacteraceae bacterium]